jgi:hypothetical protein
MSRVTRPVLSPRRRPVVSDGRADSPRVLNVGSASAADGDVAENRELGDTTTFADPTVVDEIKTRAATEKTEE